MPTPLAHPSPEARPSPTRLLAGTSAPPGRALPKSVADYEPALALYSGTDGLDIIHRIAKELPKHLAYGGTAWIEVDSPTAETARALFATQGLSAEIRTDQYGMPRVIVVSYI